MIQKERIVHYALEFYHVVGAICLSKVRGVWSVHLPLSNKFAASGLQSKISKPSLQKLFYFQIFGRDL